MAENKTEKKRVSFEDIHLKVGDRMQMQPAGTADPMHYAVQFMGALKGASLLTTLPIIDHEGIWMRHGGEYIFRVLGGSHVYAFTARLIKARAHPYSYAHFSIPEHVESRRVRHSSRIALQLASEAVTDEGKTVPVTIVDLSQHGAMVESREPLGKVGETVRISLPISLAEVDRKLELEADIRNITDGETPRHGLEFHPPAKDDALLLHFFIDHQIAEAMNGGT